MSGSLLCLPHFNVFSDFLLYRPVPTRNLFVLYNEEANFVDGEDRKSVV